VHNKDFKHIYVGLFLKCPFNKRIFVGIFVVGNKVIRGYCLLLRDRQECFPRGWSCQNSGGHAGRRDGLL